MAAGPELIAQLDELIALFNRKGMDLPDGLFDRHTQFRLNGVPFEEMLGRSSADPLVLMIARGPAGYRFAMKAIHHAVPDARIERGDLPEDAVPAPAGLVVSLWLSGHLRGTEDPIETVMRATITLRGATVAVADLAIDPPSAERLREARLRS